MQLTLDEANVLRYACGFVGMKLHKKFLKIKGVKAAEFTELMPKQLSSGRHFHKSIGLHQELGGACQQGWSFRS